MKLKVQNRDKVGKVVKFLRKEGLLPAVVYGKSMETPAVISCDKNDFIRLYRKAGYSTPINLEGDVKQMVLLHSMEIDTLTDEVLSVDFIAVSKTEKVSADVTIVLVGESAVEKTWDGAIQLVKDTVEVEAFPQDLPQQIELNISQIKEANEVLFVKDLKVSNKVEILDDPEIPVVTVTKLSGTIEEESDEVEESSAENTEA